MTNTIAFIVAAIVGIIWVVVGALPFIAVAYYLFTH